MASESTIDLRRRVQELDTKWLMEAVSPIGREGAIGWYPEGAIAPHNTGARCIAIIRAELKRRGAPNRIVGMWIRGGDLRAGDSIATVITRGMEEFEAPVAEVDHGGSLATFTRADGTRGDAAADERIYVLRRRA